MGETGLPLKITKLGEQGIINMSLPQKELKKRSTIFLKLEQKKNELKAF